MSSFSLTQLLLFGSAAGIGLAVFLLARALWPERFISQTRALAKEAATRRKADKK